jgi:hypothetical protein
MPVACHTRTHTPHHTTKEEKKDKIGHPWNKKRESERRLELKKKEGYLCSLKQTTFASEPDCACLLVFQFHPPVVFPPLEPWVQAERPILDEHDVQEEGHST